MFCSVFHIIVVVTGVSSRHHPLSPDFTLAGQLVSGDQASSSHGSRTAGLAFPKASQWLIRRKDREGSGDEVIPDEPDGQAPPITIKTAGG